MKVYPFGHATLEESQETSKTFHDEIAKMDISDEDLIEYIKSFFKYYRGTIERFFQPFKTFLALYSKSPFETKILRLGENGIIFCHRPGEKENIQILRPSDFDPPLSSINIFEIQERLKSPFMTFSFVYKEYNKTEAEMAGKRQALNDALNLFWQIIDPVLFNKLCAELIKAEGLNITPQNLAEDNKFDSAGLFTISEPGGSRRVETWAFDYKTYHSRRISAKELRETEKYLERNLDIDVMCLITSGDLTSIGNNIVVRNPRIRLWDRQILSVLVHKNIEILEEYFAGYNIALDTLQRELQGKALLSSSDYQEFKERLSKCPPGREHFADYEKICNELFEKIFASKLGEPKYQPETLDKKQRRDILFRNHQVSRFFQRIASKFSADFIILDSKNYTEEITSNIVFDVAKYVNKALGRFIIIASRQGGASSVEAAQLRVLRDDDAMVIILSDAHLLEMLKRYENNENPEDVLEDLVDEVLLKY